MKIHAKNIIVALVIGLTFCTGVLFGQSKTGTTIGQFLLIEPSARAAGMANVGVAMHEEVVSAFFNPAAIGMQEKFGIQFTNSQWIADIQYNYVAGLIHAGNLGNIYLSATALNSGEIKVRTVDQPLGTGERYSVSNVALGLGYGTQLTDRFSVGFQLNYIQENIWHSSLSTFAINVGTIYHLTNNRMRIGASISNFGLQAGYSGRDLRIRYDLDTEKYGDNSSLPGDVHTTDYALPILFRVGIYMPWQFGENNQIEFALDAFHPNDNTESMSAGVEWAFMKMVFLRGGFQHFIFDDGSNFPWVQLRKKDDSELGLTAGAGIKYDLGEVALLIDYAWTDNGLLENTQRLTMGVSF
ncbi:MAG: hypothetical protein DWQ05_22970 [Calditrichaeota bacterium]|nr:MAG: hypothetical protein DWQ05_22970 [Calditrichota bacterium]